jgi:uncharacterized protein YecT (DUF1311 family)
MIALFVAVSVAATDPQPDCLQNPNATQGDLNDCAHQQFERADRALNVQWRKTSDAARRTDKSTFDRLLKGQRAWLTYRSETCGWVGDTFGGSIGPLNYYLCMAGMTEARTKELESLAVNPNSGEPL